MDLDRGWSSVDLTLKIFCIFALKVGLLTLEVVFSGASDQHWERDYKRFSERSHQLPEVYTFPSKSMIKDYLVKWVDLDGKVIPHLWKLHAMTLHSVTAVLITTPTNSFSVPFFNWKMCLLVVLSTTSTEIESWDFISKWNRHVINRSLTAIKCPQTVSGGQWTLNFVSTCHRIGIMRTHYSVETNSMTGAP